MKNLWKRYDATIIFAVLGLLYIAYCVYSDWRTAIAPAVIYVAVLVAKIIYEHTVNNKLLRKVNGFGELLDVNKGEAFERLEIPCCVIDDNGGIVWFNSNFALAFEVDKAIPEVTLPILLGNDKLDMMKQGKGYKFRFRSSYYSVNSTAFETEGKSYHLLYFIDGTELRNLNKKYNESRPVVILTLIDNSDDIYEKFPESKCAAIFSEIEQTIDDWASEYGAMCRKYSNSRMLIIAEEKALQKMEKDKFTVLETIRNLKHGDTPVDVTLSIGVGRDGTIIEVRDYARQALDMSQSRGGDQVAVKDSSQYKFYGGKSEGKEQKNKVKTRQMAKSISELIKSSSNVIVMGHRFSDYDAFGSSAGIYTLARHLGVEANILIDKDTTLATMMVDQFIMKAGLGSVVSKEKALSLVNDNTLLVVCDTHKRDFTDCPELVDRCKKVMVIDHHRKSVGYIEDTVMFYHRPNSSSASEMVAEILQYAEPNSKKFVDPITAQALIAGIMLDTRSYVIRCGERTFEAAAFLKSCSANTVAAKKLFSSDMDLFRSRNAVIDSAEKYRNICAISVADFDSKNIRLITSQAADEMLNIANVKASFVLYRNGNDTNISARSFGEVNVQLIMEALGGGGHQAMSACQLKDTEFEEAKAKLCKAIDDYLEEK